MGQDTLLIIGRPPEPLLARLVAAAAPMEPVVGDDPAAFAQAASHATVVLCWTTSGELIGRVLALAPQVRWVHDVWAGLDHLPLAELAANETVLTNGRGLFSGALGEWVLGAILYFAKDFRRLVRSQRDGRWDPYHVVGVAGQTVGIVGYGDIGLAVARRAKAMGMRVLGLTRRGLPSEEADDPAEQIFTPAERLRMIEQCDYLVVAAPLTAETRGLIGQAEIAAMKPEAVIINVGRGPVIHEDVLVDALSSKRIKGAALDVFEREPLPEDHPLYRLDNVLLSPHSADRTSDWLENAVQLFLDNLERYRRGEPLVNVVDKQLGY